MGDDASLALAGAVGDAAALDRLMKTHRVALAVVRAPSLEHLRRWTRRHHETAFVAIVDPPTDAGVAALAPARGALSPAAGDAEIAVTPRRRRAACVCCRAICCRPAIGRADRRRTVRRRRRRPAPRELEVLAAMADGASNKVIAGRLGISFHTVKFHVAGILAKLDADSRTEAVTKAAQLGLVML